MGETPTKQLVIPKALREKVMEFAHDSKLSGHQGMKRTQDRIKACFYWPGRDTDVRRYIHTVPEEEVDPHAAPLGKMPLIDTPFKRISIDLIGPIKPKSSEGHQYILTVIDYATG